jgi:hypothetical protein
MHSEELVPENGKQKYGEVIYLFFLKKEFMQIHVNQLSTTYPILYATHKHTWFSVKIIDI